MNDRKVGSPGGVPHGGGRAPATMATQARHQAPMASYAPRPVGPWQALRTADGKHVYYHNAATNETTWTRPPNYVDPGPPGGLFPAPGSMAAAPSAASAPSSVTQIPVPGTTWYEVTQPGKPSYFHDAATRAVVWAPPPAVLEARRRGPLAAPTATGHAPRPRDATETTRKRAREEAPASREEAPPTDPPREVRREARRERTASPPPEQRRDETRREAGDDAEEEEDDVEFDPDAYEMDVFEAPEETAEATAPETTAPEESAPERAAREFRELLTEKGVNATSRWDRKSRELSSDARFKAVRTHAERRRLFERHARDAGGEKRTAAAPREAAAAVAAARASERRRREASARRERELAVSNVARLRAKNARDVAAEQFEVLLAESEKKWNLAATAAPSFDDVARSLRADAQGRASAIPGAFEEADMRALFEAYVARAIRARVADVAALLDEKLVARSAKDFEEEEETNDVADADAPTRKNPLASFVAACAFGPLASDPRWDRCPVEAKASAYCRRIETLCAALSVERVPEDVAALRDALAEAREERLAEKARPEESVEGLEEGEAVDDGGG